MKSLAVWAKNYWCTRISIWQCWGGWASSWCQSPGRCTSAGRASSWCAVCWWSSPHTAHQSILCHSSLTVASQNHLAKRSLPNRLYYLIVFEFKSLAHVLKTPFLRPNLHSQDFKYTKYYTKLNSLQSIPGHYWCLNRATIINKLHKL